MGCFTDKKRQCRQCVLYRVPLGNNASIVSQWAGALRIDKGDDEESLGLVTEKQCC